MEQLFLYPATFYPKLDLMTLADTIGIIQHGKLLTELPIEEIHKHQTDYISLQVDDVARVCFS